MLDLKKCLRLHLPIMQFIFVEIIRYGVNHGHWHFVFGIEVKQTDCIFQFNNYFRKNPVF